MFTPQRKTLQLHHAVDHGVIDEQTIDYQKLSHDDNTITSRNLNHMTYSYRFNIKYNNKLCGRMTTLTYQCKMTWHIRSKTKKTLESNDFCNIIYITNSWLRVYNFLFFSL